MTQSLPLYLNKITLDLINVLPTLSSYKYSYLLFIAFFLGFAYIFFGLLFANPANTVGEASAVAYEESVQAALKARCDHN